MKKLFILATISTVIFASCSEAEKAEQLLPGEKVKITVDFVAIDHDGSATESRYASGNIIVQ